MLSEVFGRDYPVPAWKKLWEAPLDPAHRAGQQVYARISGLIDGGAFSHGQRLPPVELLARKLATTRVTIHRCYRRLRSANKAVTVQGKGTYVNRPTRGHDVDPVIPADAECGQVAITMPERRSAVMELGIGRPMLGEEATVGFLDAINQEWSRLRKAGMGQDGIDQETHESAKAMLLDRGIPVAEGQVGVVPNGMGFYLVIRCLVGAGDVVAMDNPDDQILVGLFRLLQADIRYTGVDKSGMTMTRLETICKQTRVKVVFVRPSASRPGLQCLTEHRRESLIRLSRKYGFWVVSLDEQFGWWHKQPLAPLICRKHGGNIIYCSPVNQLFPGSRDLSLVVAHPRVIASIRYLMDLLGIDKHPEAVLAVMRASRRETTTREGQRLLRLYQRRQKQFQQLFRERIPESATLKVPHAGLHLVITLKQPTDLQPIIPRLTELGLYQPIHTPPHSAKPAVTHIRFGYANVTRPLWLEFLQLLKSVL